MRILIVPIALVTLLSGWAQQPSGQQSVPFVGCPADGQTGPIAAPHGQPRTVTLPRTIASALAYYAGAVGPGVFAPRGWRCRVRYGSGGGGILVAPTLPLRGTRGAAVEEDDALAGTSGRFEVAFTAARLFRKVAASFIEQVRKEGLAADSEFAHGPYPDDSLSYLDSATVQYVTPPFREGLGTKGILVPSAEPIRGLVMLDLPDSDSDGGLSVLRVRLGRKLQGLALTLVRLNGPCNRREGGC